MKWIEKQLIYLTAEEFKATINEFLEQLESQQFPNVIIDDVHNKIAFQEIEPLGKFQNEKNKSLVVIKPAICDHDFPKECAITPTLKEAIDYISFEQMQRDLGL